MISAITTKDNDPDGPMWLVSFSGQLSSQEAAKLPQTLVWDIWLKDEGKYLYGTQHASRRWPKGVLASFQFKVVERDLTKILNANPYQTVIVFSADGAPQSPAVHIPLGDLLRAHPSVFKSL